jgi:glutathione S-transferase
MTLRLYYHPFSSFCQKVLVALWEREVSFEGAIVDLGDPDQRAGLERLWRFAKFPVLVDEARGVTLPESSIIIEYVDRLAAGSTPLIPVDPEEALRVRLWDRFFDSYVELPLQKVVGDALRPEGERDPLGVAEARRALATAWEVLEAELGRHGGEWGAGDSFSMADCAAAPALFYANIIVPFAGHVRIRTYFERLLGRPSFARAVEEAQPYRAFFPLGWPEGYPG